MCILNLLKACFQHFKDVFFTFPNIFFTITPTQTDIALARSQQAAGGQGAHSGSAGEPRPAEGHQPVPEHPPSKPVTAMFISS